MCWPPLGGCLPLAVLLEPSVSPLFPLLLFPPPLLFLPASLFTLALSLSLFLLSSSLTSRGGTLPGHLSRDTWQRPGAVCRLARKGKLRGRPANKPGGKGVAEVQREETENLEVSVSPPTGSRRSEEKKVAQSHQQSAAKCAWLLAAPR